MRKPLLFLPLLLLPLYSLNAQDFQYGAVSLDDLTMRDYAGDSTASAVVLKEFGDAFILNDDGYHVVFKYHVRIKILRKDGLDQANIEIPLYRQDNNRFERITELKASSFNIEDGVRHEAPLSDKNVFTDERSEHLTVKKFAVPNVRVGSVIEYSYTMTSPFLFTFRTWEFQGDIPKVESDFRASIPGVFIYNITLRGFLKLQKEETSIARNCLGSGGSIGGGYSADCAVMELGMKDIPAFVEEDFMTAKKNFISAIHFELSEVRYFDGRVDKFTKEWKDAEEELRRESRFGVQLKRGKDIGNEVEKLVQGQTDELAKARTVYNFIKGWYMWNDTYGKYSELGIKKAFDEKTGNVGDINLSLIAALRFAGLDAEPVILSTRANGLVVELHPVLSEFNYVVAKVNIGEQVYLADATEKHYPFGLLPERCLNGKGRVIGDRDSYWIDLKPADIGKTFSSLSVVLGGDGVMRGTLITNFIGYEAVNKRSQILSYPSQQDYIKDLQASLGEINITGYELKNLGELDKPVIRNLTIEISAFDDLGGGSFLFNPFLLDKWAENPFKSNERLYPVDFGVPLERTTILNLQYPEGFEIVNVPEKVGLALPNGGGRFILDVRNVNNRLSMNHSLSIRKAVYNATEYHYLKELFNRIIQVQNGDLIFRHKN